jgi:hypothetical protein
MSPLVSLARRVRWLAKLVRDIRSARAEQGVGTLRIVRELLVLNLTKWMGVRAYFQYRLFDPKLTLRQKSQYLPDSKWATERLWSLLNPVQYRMPFRNKLLFSRLFGGQGLPVARVHGVYDPQVGHTPDGQPLRNAADLRSWLRSCGGAGFVFKALWGREGYQVLVFAGAAPNQPDSFVTLSGDRYDAGRLVEFTRQTDDLKRVGADEPESYLIEERIRPHPVLAELVGPTLCCVRIVTLIGLSGEPRILGAVYKIQPKPLGVDHLSFGALGSWVDLDSGRLGPGRSRHEFGYASVIPGTDRNFVGFQLPGWSEVKNLALRAAVVFPWARAIGWDIAISDRGPILIEGNAEWSTSLLQIPAPHGLATGEFKLLCDTLAGARAMPRQVGSRATIP